MRYFADHIRDRLKDLCCPLWWPGLAESLVANGQQWFGAPGSGYSTSRFTDAIEPTALLDVAPADGHEGPHLRIEFMPTTVALRFQDRGVVQTSTDQVGVALLKTLSDASMLIGKVPSLSDTIERLAQSVHILQVDDPSYDVSFSDPSIPFSIFVSAAPGAMAAARMAEAIIHESMHLQLTLVERVVPLVLGNRPKQYSPWKRELRPVSGIVHALYVFGVIDQWLQRLGANARMTTYARHRRVQISKEVRQLDFASYSGDLTEAGRNLMQRLAPHGGPPPNR